MIPTAQFLLFWGLAQPPPGVAFNPTWYHLKPKLYMDCIHQNFILDDKFSRFWALGVFGRIPIFDGRDSLSADKIIILGWLNHDFGWYNNHFSLCGAVWVLKHVWTVAGTHNFQNESSWLPNGTMHLYVRAVDWMWHVSETLSKGFICWHVFKKLTSFAISAVFFSIQ